MGGGAAWGEAVVNAMMADRAGEGLRMFRLGQMSTEAFKSLHPYAGGTF